MTPRLEQAFAYANDLHKDQRRKSTDVPYVTHLMAVASLVGEHGGDEDQMIAALLHDAVEDQGGAPVLAEIRKRFGDRVATIVHGCTDTHETPKPPWRARKEAYVRHLHEAEPDVLLVSASDKLHNSRAIVAGLRREGLAHMERFKGKTEGTLWYYAAVLDVFEQRLPGELADELGRTVAAMYSLVRAFGQAGDAVDE